ncbi:MAG: tryptophan synthase subunit alpha [Phycisphaerales bacterium]|jgi:tryptophan synthase alpha chain|nr:tryptophan synthase subunit alpha [Phycisphaerales bacterium]
MSRIDTIFSNGNNKFIPFIVAGDPSLEETEKCLLEMDKNGADIIEIGFPFSDPIADGPVIAAAMQRSLQLGITPAHVIGLVSRIRAKLNCGLIAMVSYSIVRKNGGSLFIDRLSEQGFDGIIIPDIDEIEATGLSSYCKSLDFTFSMLIAPTTPLDRVTKLANISTGFLYVLARTGLTGEQSTLPDLSKRIDEIRQVTKLPLAVGFGITSRAQVKQVHKYAEAAIVGSALVRRLDESDNPSEVAGQFVAEISN